MPELETTETSQETKEATVETKDTTGIDELISGTKQSNLTMVDPKDLIEPEPEIKPEETIEGEETTSEAETTETTENEVTEDLIEWKVNDQTGKFNLKDETDRRKVTEILQKNLHYEQERQKQKDEQELINRNAVAMGNYYLHLMSKGQMAMEEPIWDMYKMKFEGDLNLAGDEVITKAKEAYDADRKKWNEQQIMLNQWQSAIPATKKSWVDMRDKFQASHPDIDVGKYITEQVDPYYAAIGGFGAVEFPPDFLEVIYKGKNFEALLQAELEKERKKKATTTSVKPETTTSVNKKTKLQGQTVTDWFEQAIPAPKNGFKLR